MEKEPEVIVAKSAGFCPGVKKAIDKVLELEASGQKPVYTIGPLIHNKQVTDMLEAKQITSIDCPAKARDRDGVMVIRAHGITPQFQREIESCGMKVVDATCPLVKKVHNVIAEYAAQGYHTVIVGDSGHAEVTGLLGYTLGKGAVVSGPEEAQQLPHYEKVNVVAQTTQKESVFNQTAEVIKNNADICQISNTICHPTKLRQTETVEMAKNADLVIVVGGKHSANTARLALLCKDFCPEVLHVETEQELNAEQVIKARKIFITAGASTPNWVIDKVASFVREARKTSSRSTWAVFASTVWNFIVTESLYTASAASALTYVCMKMQGLPTQWPLLAFSWLFIFSLVSANHAVENKSGKGGGTKLGIGIGAAVIALAVAAFSSLQMFLIAAVFLAAGFTYPFRHQLKSKLFSIPGTKDLITALGWAFTCAYLPAYLNDMLLRKASYLAIFYTVLLVFIRSVTLGFTSANKDLMIGKESFYKAFGIRVTRLAIAALLAALTLALVTLLAITWKPGLVGMLLVGNLYTIYIVIYYYTHPRPRGVKEETVIDGQFFILWILAYFSRYI